MSTPTPAPKKPVRRNVRSGVVDRWYTRETLRDENGAPVLDKNGREQRKPTARHGKGLQWQARFVSHEGREVGKSFAKKADANRWLAAQMADVERHEFIPADRKGVTVDVVAKTWLAAIESRKPSTRAGYLNRWRVHVQPRWGAERLADIEHADVVQWVAELRQAGQSVSSIAACWGVLNQIMRLAIRNKNLLQNPCADVALPRADHAEHKEYRVITIAELRRLAQEADRGASNDDATPPQPSQNGLIILTLGLVGLRFGELAGLQVRDVDFTKRTLRIRRSATEVDGHVKIGSPKSGGPRTVSFPTSLSQRLRAQTAGRGPDDYLFPQGSGMAAGVSQPLRRTNWSKRVFTPAVERAGLQPLVVHELRHCYASAAVRAGASIMVVQKQLGHSRASITLDVYSDLFADDLSDAADRLDAEFAAGALETAEGQ